jgi:hypothetical protein
MADRKEWIHLGVVDGKVRTQFEHVSLESLGILTGHLQVSAGMILVKEKGMDIEDVKSALWDIYDAAMACLEDNLRRGDGDGEEKTDDGQR